MIAEAAVEVALDNVPTAAVAVDMVVAVEAAVVATASTGLASTRSGY